MDTKHLSFSTILLLALAACGGGGGSSSGSGDQSSCSATTTAPYLSTSYDSCAASDSDLTGLWVIVSDYSIVGRNAERNKQQRMMMRISNSGSNLEAYVCNTDSSLREYTFAAGDSGLSLHDDRADADLELSIVSNVLMEGQHVGGGVNSSTVTAIKIQDAISMGQLNLNYELNGYSFSQDDIALSCFSQNKGTTELLSVSVDFDGESTVFFVDVNNNGTNEELSLSVFKPTDPSDELEINLNFDTTLDEIEGENTGNTSADYVENSGSSINLNASVIDDHIATNTAEFELTINL
ncbi:hypothetical protein [Dasania marina]|uniref:hypothetical protein n=1 Tax=Dasania marina TaxID=471499 RepID=UPI000376EE77|nr:hypothetical protein [Dasania marina]